MGILSGLMGNASEIDIKHVEREFEKILVEGEQVEKAYKLIRDLFVFTDKRLILLDKQGVTGKKVEYHSIPYKSITHFSVETAGNFDLDSELKIWISGTQMPIEKQFKNDKNIYGIQKSLASYVLR
ncbi:PH domain-containing protein [Clostridium pasteurianum]|uniref:PH domain-containing protein n=1 Tax=Clostridium pasteurianum TaxID=1501 RepID=UPI002260D6CA|nr:PH domain-containing protein [Clostridium pasteurianum]UZW13432.1 PH domain-containing protein [Clostridium pasteurianum]